MINRARECFKKLLYPKYVIMKGVQIENRAIMFLGIDTELVYDDYGYPELKFSNMKANYYRNNIYKRIYTFKELLTW